MVPRDDEPIDRNDASTRDSSGGKAPLRDVEATRRQLLDWMLIVVAVIGAPMAAMDMYSIATRHIVGFAPVYFVVYLTVLACALLRSKLSFTLRGTVLLIDLFAIGTTMLATRALTGAGDMLLAAAAVLATVLFGLRVGLAVVCLALGVYAAAAFAFASKLLTLSPSALPDLESVRVWLKSAVVFLLFVLVVAVSPGILQARLSEALRLVSRRTREIERAHLELRREVEDRRKAEKERSFLEEQLLQSQKLEAIGRLAGGIAHDFNNILTGVLGSLAIVKRMPQCDEPLRGRIDTVEYNLNRATELTRQLLAFSRKQVIELRPVDVNAVVQGIPELIGRLIGEDIRLHLVTNAQASVVKADFGQLQQVLTNLAVNARDAMPIGGDLHICTSNTLLCEHDKDMFGEPMPAGAYLCLTVTDTGTGIAPELLPRVFEPFFTTKAPDKGTGLGLSMVHGIVKQHGGAIRVHSTVGQGTTFEILLPTAQGNVSGEPKRDEKDLPQGDETILVVEDEPLVREVNTGILEQLGYKVLSAKNGKEALAVAAEFTRDIHLLLTDVVMPELNGNEVAARLLVQRPSLKVLFCSGYTDEIISRHGVLEAGVHFLAKPFTVFQLARKVRDVLDSVE